MDRIHLLMTGIMLVALSCSPGLNPLLTPYDTPFDVAPFDKITEDHYMPAIAEGMTQQLAEIQVILVDEAEPTFANTIEALEFSGSTLDRVSAVFFNLEGANTNERMQGLAREISPLLSGHYDEILLNSQLFERVQAVWSQREELDLDVEQATLLRETYRTFIRNGARLDVAQKGELTKINQELSKLSVAFGEHILAENNAFELVIGDEEELAGLPESSISAAAETAGERGHKDKWVFTLHKPSLIPFLQYSAMRAYRERMFKGYIMRGDNGDENDNNVIAARMAALRVRRANLLGYSTHAAYVLEENMAKTPETVYGLLDQLWAPALAKAKREAAEFQAMIDAEGGGFKLEPWDWWYYAEKVKKAKYDLDDEQLRPYFELENVIQGAFEVGNRLWGLTFEERFDLPKYHEDVRTFEVKDRDGSHLAVYLVDYYPRASKRGGAWMNSFRKQSKVRGQRVTPVIYNVGNFTKPTADKPALITFEEAKTLFHEFGHALHGFFADQRYESLSGTATARDFVEYPSQVHEMWATWPSVLSNYAKHYETGETIPAEMIEKIEAASKFNQGYDFGETVEAALLDMKWSALTPQQAAALDTPEKVDAFERRALEELGLEIDLVPPRYRSTYFNHIFSSPSGYSAGYYSYLWTEMLDRDSRKWFRENGGLTRENGDHYRATVLSRGGTMDYFKMFENFAGRQPDVTPMLEARGLTGETDAE